MSAAARRRMSAGGAEGDDKAFWISFADLMTALMVLFLVVMAVALLTITRAQTSPTPPVPKTAPTTTPPTPPAPSASTPANPPLPPEIEEIERLIRQVTAAVDAAPGVRFDARRHVIDFGDRARFETGSHRLDAASAKLLREFVPQLLAITQSELGLRWVRRVVVEGFADQRGNYLYNLDLSLRRAERVMCTLLESQAEGPTLTDAQRLQVKSIFAVGGFSFNDQRASLDASRRIEMRIEFGPPPATAPNRPNDDSGSCRLGA